MFDPTIFENLKIVVEGAVYDLDLQGDIQVVNRNDIVDLALMSRTFSIDFMRKTGGHAVARIELSSDASDFAGEKFALRGEEAGSCLQIGFMMTITDEAEDCRKIEKTLEQIWDSRPAISQRIYYEYGMERPQLSNHIRLTFGRKINESHIVDITDVLQHILRSLDHLDELSGRETD